MTGKIHLGNMDQTVTRYGARQTLAGAQPPNAFPANGVPVTNRGVLNTQNLGTFQRDVFTFAPEMNMKVGVEVMKNWMVTAGYSFIYYDHVALADNQIDQIVDPLGTIGVPAFGIKDAGFWFQSLDLGLTIAY